MLISVHSRADMEAGLVTADALISICGQVGPVPRIDTSRFTDVLSLVFDDVPAGTWQSPEGLLRGPTDDDVAAALAFARARPGKRLAVHCEQGRSRSAGIALAILADRFGPGGEGEAVAQLMVQARAAGRDWHPNPLIVAIADRRLGRSGAIAAALQAGCPRYVSWVGYWRTMGVLGCAPPGHDDQYGKQR